MSMGMSIRLDMGGHESCFGSIWLDMRMDTGMCTGAYYEVGYWAWLMGGHKAVLGNGYGNA